MNKERAVIVSVWLIFLFFSMLFFAYITSALVHNARLLYEYEPPTQIERVDQHRIQELEQRIEVLEDMLGSVEEFIVTAYTHAAPGGCINGTGDGLTASGLPVSEGLVAADSSIPFGTRVWVEGFGVLTVADRGGAIRGNRLDIFMDERKDALLFGRRRLKAVVLP